MADFKPVSPPVTIYSGYGREQMSVTVYGWYSSMGDWYLAPEPVVANPDGPGIGPWSLYYGSDPWHAS